VGDWRPVLEGDDAAAARSAVDEIVAALDGVELDDPSVEAGLAGVALLHGYRARAGEDGAAEAASEALAAAIERIDRLTTPWLFRGVAGLGFALHHLADVVAVEDDACLAVDALVLDLLAAIEDPPIELMKGVVGLGVYGLERGEVRIVETVVDRLAAAARRDDDGVHWRLGPGHLIASERAAWPGGYVNLGLAHGVAGAVGFLAAARPWVPAAAALLDDAVAWLLLRERPAAGQRFPMILEGENPGALVDGWCYGDPGTAAALVAAGVASGRPELVARGRALSHHAVGHPPDEAAPRVLYDAALCHGAAGRAHIFNRLGQAIGDAALLAAARREYLDVLARRRPGAGIAGFGRDLAGGGAALLDGATGIALALVAATSEVEPAWDRLLLLAPP
jgi:lantibiotic biosynthesis protein